MKFDYQGIIDMVKALRPVITERKLASDMTKKGFGDFVTQVDLTVQRRLMEELRSRYGDVGFIAEEQEHRATDLSRPTFILDPIDGTANLLKDYRHSAVSLALAIQGETVFGVVYNPFSDEVFSAVAKEGAYLNGRRISVSPEELPENCLITFGTSPYQRENAVQEFAAVCEVYRQVADVRRSGSAALDLCYVACGRTEGFFEPNLKPWDYAAGALILSEAGGVATDYTGAPLPLLHNSCVLAGNPVIYRWLRAVLANF